MSDGSRKILIKTGSVSSQVKSTGAERRIKTQAEIRAQLSRIRNNNIEPAREDAYRLVDKIVTTGRLGKVVKSRKDAEDASMKLARYLRLYDNLMNKYKIS